MDQLTGPSRTIAEYLMGRQGSVEALTTGEIARQCDTSRSTVSRFCRRLGYSGFFEFKTAFTQEQLAARNESEGEDGAGLDQEARRAIDASLASIREAVSTIDPDQLQRAVDALCRASLVVWAGATGGSANVAASGQWKMTRSGKKAYLVSDNQGLQDMREIVEAGDALVVVSHSGRWKSVAEEMKAFRTLGCTVVLITASPRSRMARVADFVLVAPARRVELGRSLVPMRAAQSLLVDLLILQVAARLKGSPLEWEENA